MQWIITTYLRPLKPSKPTAPKGAIQETDKIK
jgi:hypothetical protein